MKPAISFLLIIIAVIFMAAKSTLGFVYLVWVTGDFNTSIFNIAFADMTGITCLVIILVLRVVKGSNSMQH